MKNLNLVTTSKNGGDNIIEEAAQNLDQNSTSNDWSFPHGVWKTSSYDGIRRGEKRIAKLS